jgi:uncharacterized coiled-coil protein SlyX
VADEHHPRLIDLEVRYSYLERVVQELDQVVIELRGKIAKLEREVSLLKSGDREQELSPAHEKPPHY